MFTLFSESLPDLEAAFRAAGHAVLSTPETWASSYPLSEAEKCGDPSDYPLDRLVRTHQPDAIVLVDWLRASSFRGDPVQFGYSLDTVRRLKNHRKLLIVVGRNDPKDYVDALGKRIRSCIARPRHATVYVTNDAETQRQAAATGRAVRWVPGADVGPLLQHIEDVRGGRRYRPG